MGAGDPRDLKRKMDDYFEIKNRITLVIINQLNNVELSHFIT